MNDQEHNKIKPKIDYIGTVKEFVCGECEANFFSTNPVHLDAMMNYVRFCPHCGKEIDWSDYQFE